MIRSAVRALARRRRGVRVEVACGAELVLGEGCLLGPRTRILVRGGRVEIGAGAKLGRRCAIVAHESVRIGPGAVLEEGVVVVDFDHGFADVERPIRLQPLQTAPVLIGADARIGPQASVLRGARVGDGATVGPHAVMTGDVPPGAWAGGVPARSSGRVHQLSAGPADGSPSATG